MSWLRTSVQCFPPSPINGEQGPVKVDIIVVQGLSAKRSTIAKTVALEELLPEFFNDARTIYADRGCSAPNLFSASTADIVDWVYYFLKGLLQLRQTNDEANRPILFLGYSFGGILVKQLLLQAQAQKQFRSIYRNTAGVVFLGTPHQGTAADTYGQTLWEMAKCLDITPIVPEHRLQDALHINAPILQQLTVEFKSAFKGPVISFYATNTNAGIAEYQSTLLGADDEEHIPLSTNHEGLFRFVGKHNPIARQISEGIDRLRQKAHDPFVPPPSTISATTVLPLQCPVCRTLPLHRLELGTESTMHYNTSLEVQDRKSIGLWTHRCVLANFVCQSTDAWACDGLDIGKVPERILAGEYTCAPAWDISKRLDMALEHNDPLTDSFQNIVVHQDPLSSQSIEHVKYWISKCRKSHSECGLEWTPLPTRVLDVSDPTSIKLVRPLGLEDKYVALSHRWGSSNNFMTTRQNMKSIRAGFSIRQAPASFRDAILVTRQLGIRYLWIDALCIVQGDIIDWEVESGRMADIFANAHVTISAASSTGDTEAFLAPRNHDYAPVVVSAGRDRSVVAYLYQKTFWDDRDEEALDTRAWALQEQYLSRRNVRYCGKQMTWRCKMATWSESAPVSDQLRLWAKPWTGLVEEFSRRKLTYETDRLPAMAGAAASVASANGEEYYAGLWLKNLPAEMLFERKAAEVPLEYIAPSWSWAAMGGPVTFVVPRVDGFCRLRQVKVSGVELKTPSGNRFGQLKRRGWLKMKAPLVQLRRKPNAMSGGTSTSFELVNQARPRDWGSAVVSCHFDTWDLAEEDEVFGLILGYSAPGSPRGVLKKLSPGSMTSAQSGKSARSSYFPDPTKWDTIHGILIVKSEEDNSPQLPFATKFFSKSKASSKGQYQRCGVFEIMGLSDDQGPQIVEGHPVESVTLC
ncbi:heterokaryon incompatibility protein-domain-containing protein [Thelonectria olida]|uniref:Heterokaryon incompatibility protein-domain-containing protein n=1 Tax=Thelonectria olida TaxID=1576542 RepID=A0A9P8WDC1_9HYPO|nr:heterokaryon incompatibility protein-domain-containing protein [Thelonectria olida]